METKSKNLGIYTSYDEQLNGHIQEAVDISKTSGYLIWLVKKGINPERFKLPTTILIKIKKDERFYRGEVTDIKRVTDVVVEEILSETSHRPIKWQKVDRELYKDFKSVLYIKGLEQIPRPHEVTGKHPPESLYYIEFDDI